MASVKSMLPDCGLYRTTKPLPGNEAEVPAGILVYFHNHSDSGLPVVIKPDHNIANRWHFHGDGVAFRGLSYATDGLKRVLPEGFYSLKKELVFGQGPNERWPKGALVQLGYTQEADPILFIAQQPVSHDQENRLLFSDRGIGKPVVTHDFCNVNLERLVVAQQEPPTNDAGRSAQ